MRRYSQMCAESSYLQFLLPRKRKRPAAPVSARVVEWTGMLKRGRELRPEPPVQDIVKPSRWVKQRVRKGTETR